MKLNKSLQISFIIISCLAISCSYDNSLSREELINYVKNPNNYLIKEKKGFIDIKVHYYPKDLVIPLLFDNNDGIVKNDLDSAKKSLKEYDYFLMELSKNNQDILNHYGGTPSFDGVLNYLTFEVGNNIHLVNNQDTVPVFSFAHVSTVGISKETKIMLIFKSNLIDKKGRANLLFEDYFFKSGTHIFEFSIDNIKKIPSLEI